jgi:hypothetical protein
MVFPLKVYLLHCTILIAYFGLSKKKLLQSNIKSRQPHHCIAKTTAALYLGSA